LLESPLALPGQQAPSEPAQPSAQADRGFDAGEAQDAGTLKPLAKRRMTAARITTMPAAKIARRWT